LTLAAALLGAAPAARADLPRVINFQGRLTNAAGAVAPNGSYAVRFRIYDAPTGGTYCHEHLQTFVTSGGLFNAQISGTTGISATCLFDRPAYLELWVGTEVLAPRVPFTAAPYAFAAGQVVQGGAIYKAGHGAGQIPVSDGVLNTGLNCNYLEGKDWSGLQNTFSWTPYQKHVSCPDSKNPITGAQLITGAPPVTYDIAGATVTNLTCEGSVPAACAPEATDGGTVCQKGTTTSYLLRHCKFPSACQTDKRTGTTVSNSLCGGSTYKCIPDPQPTPTPPACVVQIENCIRVNAFSSYYEAYCLCPNSQVTDWGYGRPAP
jgi:hypothetical protein